MHTINLKIIYQIQGKALVSFSKRCSEIECRSKWTNTESNQRSSTLSGISSKYARVNLPTTLLINLANFSVFRFKSSDLAIQRPLHQVSIFQPPSGIPTKETPIFSDFFDWGRNIEVALQSRNKEIYEILKGIEAKLTATNETTLGNPKLKEKYE